MGIQILFQDKTIIDLTSHVDPLSIQKNKSIDDLLNYGSFVIPKINGVIDGLDFSRAIPRGTRAMVDDVYYRIGESKVVQNGIYWRHEVQLISPKKMMQRKPIANTTLTQPIGDIGNYIRSTLNLNDSPIYDLKTVSGYKKKGVMFTSVNKSLQYEVTNQSANVSILEGNTLKEAGRLYTVKVYMNIYNTEVIDMASYPPIVEVTIKIGGVTVFNKTKNMKGVKPEMWAWIFPTGKVYPTEWIINESFEHTTVNANEQVEIIVKGSGKYFDDNGTYDMKYYVVDNQITVYTNASSVENEKKTYDYWVNRLLSGAEGAYYIVDDETKSRLREFISPDWTLESYDLATALDEAAESIGAKVTIPRYEYRSTGFYYDIISFQFYDDLERQPIVDIPGAYQISKESELENYVSELVLDVNNLISDVARPVPYKGGTISLRALNSNTQIDTANIAVKAPLGIYQVTKFIVKGLSITTANRTVTEHDITRRVVNKERWDALSKASDYTMAGRVFVNANQNNMLYYIQGDNTIYNMGGTGTLAPAFSGSNRSNRAIFECCAAEVSEYYSETVTNWDAGLSINDNIQIYFEYRAYGETRASVFKEDQSGFIERISKFFNETAKLNDPKALGESAQSIVNRIGNTQVIYVGRVNSESELGFIGGLNSKNEKLVSIRSIRTAPDRYDYTAIYVKDFTLRNRHIGIKSQIREYEVPKINTVVRNKRRVYMITFGVDETEKTAYPLMMTNILNNIQPITPTLAVVKFVRPDMSLINIGASVDERIIGNSITWNIKMPDNYSAGSRKIRTTISSVTTTWDEEVRYTDVYGRLYSYQVEFLENYIPMTLEKRDLFPEIFESDLAPFTPIDGKTHYNFDNKDAREVFAYTVQYAFSGTGNVIVYNLNKKVYNSGDIRLAAFHYIPSKQAKKVDISRVTILDTNTTVRGSDHIRVNMNSIESEGYGWFDNNSGDLIMFHKGNNGGIQYIYIKEVTK